MEIFDTVVIKSIHYLQNTTLNNVYDSSKVAEIDPINITYECVKVHLQF